jgi:hypothetical protein
VWLQWSVKPKNVDNNNAAHLFGMQDLVAYLCKGLDLTEADICYCHAPLLPISGRMQVEPCDYGCPIGEVMGYRNPQGGMFTPVEPSLGNDGKGMVGFGLEIAGQSYPSRLPIYDN